MNKYFGPFLAPDAEGGGAPPTLPTQKNQIADMMGTPRPDKDDPTNTPPEPTPAPEPTPEPVSQEPASPPPEPTPSSDPTPPPAADPEPAIDPMVEEVNRLSNIILELQGQQTPNKSPEPETPPQTPPAATPTADPVKFEGVKTQEDLDELTSDVNKFNEFLGGLAASVRTQTLEEARQANMADVSAVNAGTLRREVVMETAAIVYAQSNPDLKPFASNLKVRANAIAASEPHLTPHEVYTKAGEEVRAIVKNKQNGQQPPTPASSNSRTTQTQVTNPDAGSMQSQIADIINRDK